MGELCAGYAKQKEQLTKDSIGDCAVVVVGLAMMIELDPVGIFGRTATYWGLNDGPTKLYLLATRTGLALWFDLG